MKKLLVVLIALILVAISSHAQRINNPRPHPSKKERRIKRIAIKKDNIRNHRLKMNLRKNRRHQKAAPLNPASKIESTDK